MSFADLHDELLAFVEPDGDALGCSAALQQAHDTVKRGTNAYCQRRWYGSGPVSERPPLRGSHIRG